MAYNNQSWFLGTVHENEMVFGPGKENEPGSIDLATPAPPPGSLGPQQTSSGFWMTETTAYGLSCPLCDHALYVFWEASSTLRNGCKNNAGRQWASVSTRRRTVCKSVASRVNPASYAPTPLP